MGHVRCQQYRREDCHRDTEVAEKTHRETAQDGRRVAVFPNPEEQGVVVEPERLREDLAREKRLYGSIGVGEGIGRSCPGCGDPPAMAESFQLPGEEWVHFSNGAVELLFRGWERIARKRAAEPGMTQVADYLRHVLGFGAGCRAFAITRELIPEELESLDCLRALGELIAETIDNPFLAPEVNWDPPLIRSWRTRLRQMQAAVRSLESSV